MANLVINGIKECKFRCLEVNDYFIFHNNLYVLVVNDHDKWLVFDFKHNEVCDWCNEMGCHGDMMVTPVDPTQIIITVDL